MSLESFLADWNRKIEETRKEMLLNASGYSLQQKSWWERNQIRITMYFFLALSMGACYYLGWIWPLRILGLMLLFLVLQKLWNLTKRIYAWIRTYVQAKKLLRQASDLKRE